MAIDQGSTLYWDDTLASPWVPEYMKGIARGLSDADMADLAAYYGGDHK